MSTIDLANAKVSYEGQNLPAINLISKLQTQLLEAAGRMAAIASTLGDLQAALLNSNTVEVKLTLSKEDFGRFRSLGGMDDSERIRQAVMALIHPEETEFSRGSVASSVQFRPVISKPAEPVEHYAPELQPFEQTVDEKSITAQPAIQKRSTTKCPRCQSLIDLPEASNDQWSVEIQCGTCGAKYLVKPQTVSA
ncbi:MAG: hypothetical protein Q8O28_09645 [Smithellaceae bacterium]|nr:hypothetical protein [Smithellaceae bacterium]